MSIGTVVPSPALLNLNTNGGGITRQTVNTNFAGKLRNAARETTLTAQRTANYVAPFVPGAAVLSASLGNAASNLASDPYAQRTQVGLTGPQTIPGADRGDMVGAMADLQQNMVSTNMQMLGVQQEMQQMSQRYLTASNMLKAQHDTEKNSINNIR